MALPTHQSRPMLNSYRSVARSTSRGLGTGKTWRRAVASPTTSVARRSSSFAAGRGCTTTSPLPSEHGDAAESLAQAHDLRQRRPAWVHGQSDARVRGRADSRRIGTRPNMISVAHDFTTPFSIQSAIGFQMQLGPVAGLDMDLTHTKNYRALRGRDINLFYDPATGYNVDPVVRESNVQNRPDPNYTIVAWVESDGGSETDVPVNIAEPSLKVEFRWERVVHADVSRLRRLQQRLRRPSVLTTSSTWKTSGRFRQASSATRCAPTGS